MSNKRLNGGFFWLISTREWQKELFRRPLKKGQIFKKGHVATMYILPFTEIIYTLIVRIHFNAPSEDKGRIESLENWIQTTFINSYFGKCPDLSPTRQSKDCVPIQVA